jgi:phospholipase C
VLLNSDGSVKSVKNISSHGNPPGGPGKGHGHGSTGAAAGGSSGGNDVSTQTLAETGGSSPALPIGIAAGVLVVGGGALYYARRHRAHTTTAA